MVFKIGFSNLTKEFLLERKREKVFCFLKAFFLAEGKNYTPFNADSEMEMQALARDFEDWKNLCQQLFRVYWMWIVYVKCFQFDER